MEEPLYQRLRLYYRRIIPLFEKPKVGAYTMLILSFFTIAIFGTFAIKPTLVTIAQLKKHIEDNKVVNEKMEDKINKLRLANVAYEQTQTELSFVLEALPQKPQTALLLAKLNRVLNENNIDVVILQFSPITLLPPASSASASALPFTLTGKASYQDALTFITLLSKIDRILTIDSVTLEPVENAGAFSPKEAVALTIKGKAYVLWENPPAGEAGKGKENG